MDKKKHRIINQHLNLPPSNQTIEQNDLDLEVFLFKYDFFEPEIDFLEKKILNPKNSFLETQSLLSCYQEKINKHIAFVTDPNLVSRDLLKAVLTQRLNKIEAYVKLLTILSIRSEQNLIPYFTDSAQKEIEAIQAHCLHQSNHSPLKEGLSVLEKIRNIEKRAPNIKKCLSALQAVKALGAEHGMACITLDQFIDALEHIMLEVKPSHLEVLSIMDKNLLQKEYLLFCLQQKALLDLRQIIDPSAQHEESQIKNIREQPFGKTLPWVFSALSQHTHKKESELKTQFSKFKAQLGDEDQKISVETAHRTPSLNTTTLSAQNTQQKKPVFHAALTKEDPHSIYPHPTLHPSNYRLFPPHPSRKRRSSTALPEDENLSVKKLRPHS